MNGIMASEKDLTEEKSFPHQDPNLGYEQSAQQNRENSPDDPFIHSQGCPKYKVLMKVLRQSRSPTRNERVLHPKPWGARDPKQIPCTCGPIMIKGLKSVPGSVRSSPVREIRKTVQTSRKEVMSPAKRPSPERLPTPGKSEVLKMFDEFCNKSDELQVKLSSATLNGMCHKIKTKFAMSMTPKRPSKVFRGPQRSEDEKFPGPEKRTVIAEVFDKPTTTLQPTIHREPSTPKSPSAIRGRLESSNVMVEIAGTNFPEPGATFPDIFGPVMQHSHERLPPFAHYVALGGGNQYFGPSDMLVSPIPAIMSYSESTEDYIPVREVLSPRSPSPGRRVPSPSRFTRRRP